MGGSLLLELAIAAAMVLLTVAIHGAGLVALSRLLRLEAREEARSAPDPLRAAGVMLVLMIGLFALHGLAIWSYAALYLLLGVAPDLRGALHLSTLLYATIGRGEAGSAPAWQLVAAIEGMNGIILLGWSTAYTVAVMARLRRR